MGCKVYSLDREKHTQNIYLKKKKKQLIFYSMEIERINRKNDGNWY